MAEPTNEEMNHVRNEDSNVVKKKIDESWKEVVDKEKMKSEADGIEMPEATFTLFISGLMMEALVALGELVNPVTDKKEENLTHARFIIDTLAMLKEKTKANLTKDEEDSLDGILYDLRMRFVNKSAKG